MAAGLEGDILRLSGFLPPGFGFGGSEIDIIRFRHELRKRRMFDRVGALQPEVIFGDIADQIPFGQADRGVGLNVAFDVLFIALGDVELKQRFAESGDWVGESTVAPTRIN